MSGEFPLKRKVYFITGTDTDAGKTLFSAAFLRALAKSGAATMAYKPVAAGCEFIDGQWRNQDALCLQRETTCKQSYAALNPVALKEAIAPHIAAQREQRLLTVDTLIAEFEAIKNFDGVSIIEGAGGWLVPLNETENMADMVSQLAINLQPEKIDLAVILVVSMKLGCINHALLSQQSIVAGGLNLAGWVANSVTPAMNAYADNLQTLQSRLKSPLLAEIPHLKGGDVIEQAAECVKLRQLRK